MDQDEKELALLHPQLRKDCVVIGRFKLCWILLMNDKNYPWFILVPAREGIREIYQLSAADRTQLIEESSLLSEQLQQHFQAEKMNIAAIGNLVPQLHLHHVVRYSHDPAWPAPVWGKIPARPYAAEELEVVCQAMQRRLGAAPHFRHIRY